MMTCLFYGEGVCANNTMRKRRRFGRWLVAQYDHAVYIGPDSVHNSRPPSYRIISSQGGSQSWSKDRVRISSFKSSALTIKGGSHVRGASEDGSNGRGLDSEHDSGDTRSEEHTSELQSRGHLVCRLLLEKKQKINFDARASSTRIINDIDRRIMEIPINNYKSFGDCLKMKVNHASKNITRITDRFD